MNNLLAAIAKENAFKEKQRREERPRSLSCLLLSRRPLPAGETLHEATDRLLESMSNKTEVLPVSFEEFLAGDAPQPEGSAQLLILELDGETKEATGELQNFLADLQELDSSFYDFNRILSAKVMTADGEDILLSLALEEGIEERAKRVQEVLSPMFPSRGFIIEEGLFTEDEAVCLERDFNKTVALEKFNYRPLYKNTEL